MKGLAIPAVMYPAPVGKGAEVPTAPGMGKGLKNGVEQHFWPHRKLQNVLNRCLEAGNESLQSASIV